MISATIKRILPRGLYGRAALILIVPILALQLVVSLAFLQRHFEGVTRQMTRNIALEIALISDAVTVAPDQATAAAAAARLGEALAMTVTLPAATEAPAADRRVFYDFSGRIVIATLRQAFADMGPIDLYDLRRVRFTLPTPHGAV